MREAVLDVSGYFWCNPVGSISLLVRGKSRNQLAQHELGTDLCGDGEMTSGM